MPLTVAGSAQPPSPDGHGPMITGACGALAAVLGFLAPTLLAASWTPWLRAVSALGIVVVLVVVAYFLIKYIRRR